MSPLASQPIIGASIVEQEATVYCPKCREKRPLCQPQAVFDSRGRPATRGVCGACGTSLFRFGATAAHEGLPRPEPAPKKPAPGKERPAKTGKARPARSARAARKVEGRHDKGPLVIVESPAKARTIGRFLGRDYTVRASIGHVRDLLRSRLSVDVEHDFRPEYRVPKEKAPVVKELQGLVADASEVYLATDPDREGEAIAWHLMEATGIEPERARRVVFHEITPRAIAEAFRHPRSLDWPLINAQQARRILDRLVGYQISPLLWERVRSRLSAGRVQSVAVRLVVDREREIRAFVPVEYWSIDAELAKRPHTGKHPAFIAHLARIDGQEVDLKDQPAAQAIVDDLQGASYAVSKVQSGTRQRRPAPPFTTSTLQQEASRRLGFAPRRTMAIAQSLYEGVDIGPEGTVGLITYMRTDSVNVSEEARDEARAYIREHFGAQFLPERPPVYKTKVQNAQEAHEAIRPTSVRRAPQAIKGFLSREQFRLYELIWRRFVASQMAPAVYDTLTVEIRAGKPQDLGNLPEPVPEEAMAPWRYLFRASGSSLRFAGFLAIYKLAHDEAAGEEEGAMLPPLSRGEVLDLVRLLPEQHFTQPPPRYTEATLVKALEELGIGRPSTYAAILSTIQDRGYVERQERNLVPTELGFQVNDLLVQHFPEVVDTGFTAHMEEDLDRISRSDADWVSVLREFYGPFSARLAQAEREMPTVRREPEETGEVCEQCGHPMVIKTGRFGKFIACSNYPTCRNTRPYLVKVGATCPKCGGEIVERRTRRRRTFYGCANYPQCDFTVWQRPVSRPCPKCGGLLTVARKGWLRCIRCEEQVPAEEGEPDAIAAQRRA